MSEEVDLFTDTLLEASEEFFNRRYRNGTSLIHRPTEDDDSFAHYLFIYRTTNGVHAIRAEETYDAIVFDVNRGLHGAYAMRANYRWLVLPHDEFVEGEELFNDILKTTAEERGYGLLTIQAKGRGMTHKVIVEPQLVEGNILESYGNDLVRSWRTAEKNSAVRDQTRYDYL